MGIFNIGDIIFQIICFIVLIGIVIAIFLFIKYLIKRKPDHSVRIEQKLDRVIDLLEKDKKH
ncbi:DUF4083 family protein [Bacillus sp. V59.32b]|uniref:DUF4083 family protein n=1 Tax=Bacillus sp. V59.32b TaxID=1758642 RepID=UPI000E3C20C7|nr:DUF4083 family protein [Bacillus sp. V59.32b]RFU68341.1 DUF4083 domain-containing protein [Bacillus sp. V59.32b]